MYRLFYFFCGLLTVLLYTCASMASLPGGPKDEIPPSIVAEKTTPNHQTNFAVREITITLDEWVKLDDPINRVLISPPLEKRADIKLKGKSVVVTFDGEEVLRENATYTINFGEAILDITEGNALENYAFVFSTGPYIDSLSLAGEVIDGRTAEPIDAATILIYETIVDSIIFQEKPFYATRSLEDGSFVVNNMKSGYFKVVAIKDENLNYLYDPASEAIGFISDSIWVDGDSIPRLTIRMTTEDPDYVIERRDTSGWNTAEFTYNRIPHDIVVTYQDPDATLVFDQKDKQITVWSLPETRAHWPLFFEDTIGGVIDTFVLRRNGRPAELEPLQRLTRMIPTGHPSDPFYFCFDRPIAAIDTLFIQTYLPDSTLGPLPKIQVLDSLKMCLILQHEWAPDSVYKITMLPGSLIDVFGETNDTLELNIPIGNIERFGNINLTVDGLDTNQAYIVELVLKEKVQMREIVSEQEKYGRTISKLKPGTYQLRITEDMNQNGRWDPANYLQKKQPEKIITTDIEQLRANWDVDVNYKWVQL